MSGANGYLPSAGRALARRITRLEARTRSQMATNLIAAASIVATDYFLASSIVEAPCVVRGFVAIALRWMAAWSNGAASATRTDDWGNVDLSLCWLARFSTLFIVPTLVVIGAAVGAGALCGLSIQYSPLCINSLDEIAPYILHGLVASPVIEELIYRGIVYPKLRAGAGRLIGLVLSGPIFWVLHWISSGGISPLNHLLAGWILSWAYEKSGSLVAPVLLHSLGNLLLLTLDLTWLLY